MIKICHISTVHKRYDTRIFQKQCTCLSKYGYEVVFIVNDNLPDEDNHGIKIKSILSTRNNKLFRIFFAPRKAFKLAIKENADIYILHDPELLSIGVKLKKTGKKVIYDSHEDLPQQILEKEWLPSFIRHLIFLLITNYIKKVYKKFNAVFTVSPNIVDNIKTFTSNVHLITNYPILEEDKFSVSLEDFVKRDNTICYSGTVYSFSKQFSILDALKNISNVKYTIVGSLDKKLHEKLKLHKAWDKVNFINKVPKKELITIYKNSLIGIVIFDYTPNMGYKKGTLGNNKIFEYMYYGLPIICTDFDLWKEIIDKYKCGIYVSPNNIDEIEAAIQYLIEHKEEAYQMGQNGREAVLKEYNWSTQEKVYINVIKQILDLEEK